MQDIVRTEQRAKQNDNALLLTPPDAIPQHDLHWLKTADEYEQVTNSVVVNPRILNPQSLYDIDLDWLVSRSLYHEWKRYYEDLPKRPSDMR